ncbi:MAG: tRNA (adenosine(37)-N6)-dimethylallyltransferase MiaA [Deltaproteobacteria bacterium]|nr:tRNA (adenosine(37)-N6)-dimethylallyltransferase MiaA [Deltaproteobacteria bacterium]MCW8892947.1 tRNA (adenosine(37)-N6)-dimethylallyltransferase MiaA [Deltaproteobacteria bacterium]MCW9049912.1 tRNA (adenosine(37)-N6)-dimethylallyltransferase MiaA [Deltaproteobacteria bacterium]
MEKKIPLLVICGPTGSGKTSLALSLAQNYPLEIISADSRQVYRGMDIGTAKATAEEQDCVPHHLIDLIDPAQEFSVAEFVDLARPVIAAISERGKLPCIVGGTGLYIKALLGGLADLPTGNEALRQQLHQREVDEGPGCLFRELQRVDPAATEQIHPHNLIRIVRALEVFTLSGKRFSELKAEHCFADCHYRTLQLAPEWSRAELYSRINSRAQEMLDLGLVEEVRGLVDRYSIDLKAFQTLGYREVIRYLKNEVTAQQMLEDIQQLTRQYAKKQLTWFRKDAEIIWVDSSTESGKVLQCIDNFILR